MSALREKLNPRHIPHMPAVKFFARLDLNPICRFLDGHYFWLTCALKLSNHQKPTDHSVDYF